MGQEGFVFLIWTMGGKEYVLFIWRGDGGEGIFVFDMEGGPARRCMERVCFFNVTGLSKRLRERGTKGFYGLLKLGLRVEGVGV